MIPIGSLGPPSRRRPGPTRRRIAALAALTGVTLVVLVLVSRGGSGPAPRAGGTRVEARHETRRTTTTVHSATTVYDISLDPSWLPKGTSRFSDSASSKAQSDQLGADSSTSAGSTGGSTGATATTTKAGVRSSTTTTTSRRATTSTAASSRRATTTSGAAPRTTAAPATTEPTPTTAVTAPPDTSAGNDPTP